MNGRPLRMLLSPSLALLARWGLRMDWHSCRQMGLYTIKDGLPGRIVRREVHLLVVVVAQRVSVTTRS